jgi:hypothetical protein
MYAPKTDVIWLLERVAMSLSSPISVTSSSDISIIALTSMLLAVHQYSHLFEGRHIGNHLTALDIALHHETMIPEQHNQISSVFWQAMYVLGSCHMSLFPETLLRRLCEIGVHNAWFWSGSPTRRVAFMMLADVQMLFLELSRRLGTIHIPWTCPGFEPLEDRSMLPSSDISTVHRPERTASSPFP